MEENEKNYLDWEGLLEYHRNLETKLSEKANTEDLADVATSGDYNDLDNTPTNVSLFTNDAGYMTSEIDNTNGHDYVEIGGIKWATMNVGAIKITDIGLYFQWGDILGYTSEEVGVDKNFTWEDYKFNPSGDGTTFNKYNSTDLKTSLDTEDDAAANAWGSDWIVPTTSELQTLSQAVNISWTDNYQESGVPGLILTDKEDSSKVLFLPATGVCNDGSIIDDDTTGLYWSKSLGNTDDKGLGLGFDKTNGTTWEYSNSRSLGFAIRPVLEGPAKRTIMGVTQLEKDKWNSKVSGIKIGESGEVISPVNGVVIIPNQSNVQADWNQNDSSADDFIKNKPGIGVANGLATLDSSGKVPSSQLPSYVDDVIEGYYHGEEDPQSGETVYNMYEDDEYTILITPESGKIYLDIPSSNSYRWSGSQYVLIGAPYDLPIASANTLGGVKVGSNLSIDQNGVLSAAAAANEVQIGGETPSSDSDVEIYIDTNEDATAEVYTKQQQDGKFVIVKELNSAPTSSTLTYTENGTVKNFKQGDEVRVPDLDSDTGYTFYKLYKLTTSGDVTTAEWDVLGAGNEEVPEVLIGGNTPSSDSEIKIFIDENADDTIEVYTKDQAKGEFTVIANSNSEPTSSTLTYTSVDGTTKNFKVGDEVRVPDAEADNGYTFYKLYALTTESNVTTATWDKLGAGGGSTNPKETVNISLTQVGGNSADLIGAAVTITDDDTGDTLFNVTWNGSIITAEIDVNTNYTVSVETIAGYSNSSFQSYHADFQNERNIIFRYAAIGVYVEAIDGTLYKSSFWASSGKTANAVVVIADACKFRIALTETSLMIHSNNTGPLENYITAKNQNSAIVDYDGEGNTNKIIQFNTTYGTNTTSYAAPYCKSYTFSYPIGQKGCLPALGQLCTLIQNKTEVNACLSACGGTVIDTNNIFWSSTFWGLAGTNRGVWLAKNDLINNDGLAVIHKVRPISAYEI